MIRQRVFPNERREVADTPGPLVGEHSGRERVLSAESAERHDRTQPALAARLDKVGVQLLKLLERAAAN